MAPLDPAATARTNIYPITFFSAQVFLITLWLANIISHIRRAATSLSPPPSTRSQTSVRNRHAKVFGALAVISLISVSVFAVAFRVLSYFEWAEKGGHESPAGLWTGWYGTGDIGVGRWRLGDWFSDVDLNNQWAVAAMGSAEGIFYIHQHVVVFIATVIFFGAEGHRRKFPPTVIASYVLLSHYGSLGCALSLFFVAILFTPTSSHNTSRETRDATITPRPELYIGIIVLFAGLISQTSRTSAILRSISLVFPIYLAFAPKITPVVWTQRHASKAAAHRSYMWAFWTVGLGSFVLYWKVTSKVWSSNLPRDRNPVWERFRIAVSKPENTNRFLIGLSNTAERLRIVSHDPSISIICSDLFCTAVSLLAWTFLRDLSVDDILDNSLLAHFSNSKPEKHVSFKDRVEDKFKTEADTAIVSPKKRGRPKKGSSSSGAPSASTLRRSTRRKTKSDFESDAEEPYEPPTHVVDEIRQTEIDGTFDTDHIVGASESTALALFLAFLGGFGQLAAGVLGAEVTAGSW